MGDEKLYQQVENELKGNPKKYTDRALMTKAEVLAEGDEKKTRYKYIELRVEKLKAQELEKEEKKQQKIQQKLDQEEQEKFYKEAEKVTKQKREISNWMFWATFVVALILGRLLGLLGFAAALVGYFAYDELLKKDYSQIIAILGGMAAALITYVLGAAFITSIL